MPIKRGQIQDIVRPLGLMRLKGEPEYFWVPPSLCKKLWNLYSGDIIEIEISDNKTSFGRYYCKKIKKVRPAFKWVVLVSLTFRNWIIPSFRH